MEESEEELKSLLVKVKKESEKAGLKLNIQKTKIMGSGPITSWQIDGETMETVTDFIWGAPKSLQMVTKAMKFRHLLLGRKVMTNIDSILKSRDITLTANVHSFSVPLAGFISSPNNKIWNHTGMVFPVVKYGCECWTMKKAER